MFNWYLNKVMQFIIYERKRILNEVSEEFRASINESLNNIVIDIRKLDEMEFMRIKKTNEINTEKEKAQLDKERLEYLNEEKIIEKQIEEIQKELLETSSAKADDKPEFDRSAIIKEVF